MNYYMVYYQYILYHNITRTFYSVYKSISFNLLNRSFYCKFPLSEILRIESIKVDPALVRRHHLEYLVIVRLQSDNAYVRQIFDSSILIRLARDYFVFLTIRTTEIDRELTGNVDSKYYNHKKFARLK